MRPSLALVSPMVPPMSEIDLGAFEAWLRSWNAAQTTITARVAMVRTVSVRYDLLTATTTQLEEWLAAPAFKGWTRVTYYSHLRSFYQWLRKSGQRADDPTEDLRRPTPPKCKPRPLSPAEQVLALGSSSGNLRAWLLLGMYAGLRAHECAKLRGEDITATTLYVVGKGGKAAVLPTHPILWELAQTRPRSGWWFPSKRASSGHVGAQTVTIAVSQLFTRLGIEGAHHRARHTYGTNLLRGGANIRVVQELMRHDSLASTQIYTEVDNDEMAAAVGTLPTMALRVA